MREVEYLYRLQEIDAQLAEHEKQRQDLAGRLRQMEQALSEARAARERLERAVAGGEHALRQSEGNLREVEGRLQELERRLYGGTVRSEKEVAALQAELEQLRHQKDDLESQALQLLMELDEQREQARKAAEIETQQAQECETAGQRMAAADAALQEALVGLSAAREELLAQISPRALSLYEQIRRTTARPVARVVEGRCEGCRLDVALLTRKAALGGAIVRCENCGRILFP